MVSLCLSFLLNGTFRVTLHNVCNSELASRWNVKFWIFGQERERNFEHDDSKFCVMKGFVKNRLTFLFLSETSNLKRKSR